MIREFKDEYSYLSNFYPGTIFLDNVPYPSVEHAYQAWKTSDCKERKAIQYSVTPGLAKAAGKRVTLRSDFSDETKILAMKGFLLQKFSRDPLRGGLLATGETSLVEGNTWHDTFWGICNNKGQNHLGKLLMEVRLELRKKGRTPKYSVGWEVLPDNTTLVILTRPDGSEQVISNLGCINDCDAQEFCSALDVIQKEHAEGIEAKRKLKEIQKFVNYDTFGCVITGCYGIGNTEPDMLCDSCSAISHIQRILEG